MSTALAPLWQIDEDLQALVESVATCDEDLLPELQAKIAEYTALSADKTDHVAHVLASMEYAEKNHDDEIARLQANKKAIRTARERLEAYVCRVITARGGKPLKGNTNTLAVRSSDAVVITAESIVPVSYENVRLTMTGNQWLRIPEEYLGGVKVELIPDKAAIKKALKDGEEVSGADLEFRSNLTRR